MNPQPSSMTPEQVDHLRKALAEERAEVDLIALLPRAQRRVATRQSKSYRRLRRMTRPGRRAFGGWPGAFRPDRFPETVQ